MQRCKAKNERGGLARIILTLVPVLLVMILIFCFSAENGEQSGRTSGEIVRWIAERLIPHFTEQSDAEQAALIERATFFVRKAAHFSEFAALGFFLCLHLSVLRRRIPIPRYPVWAFAIGSLYGVSDEIHQRFVPGRSGEWRDMLIDSAGVLLGTLLMAGLLWIVSRNHKKMIDA